MQLVTLDFETFFDSEYTLSKMTTEEYVRDPRFKVHCVGLQDSNGAHSFPNTNGLKGWIYGGSVLCHHAHFDGLILNHHYGIKPEFWFDTLSMARLVLPHLKSHSLGSLAEYYGLPCKSVPYNEFKGKRDLPPDIQHLLEEGCKHDVELTYEIFKRLLPHVSQEELRVIDLTVRMFTEPVLELDKDRMERYLQKTIEDKEALLAKCKVTEQDLASSNKFAKCLQAIGVVPPTKTSLRTGKETFALAKTDAAFKELCDSPDDIISSLCAARLGVKSTIAETRAGRLLGCSNRGALPVYLKYYGAHTGRWSGGDKVNWQNFPRGGEIRKSILAPEGHVLVILDLSQIECRMLNYLAKQEDVLEAFRNGRDLYCEAASRFYGRTITKEDKTERQLFKQVELGCGYGMGAAKFRNYVRQSGITVSESEAEDLIRFYRQTHPMVKKYWKDCDNVLNYMGSTGEVKFPLPNGAYDIYHGLHRDENNDWYYVSRGRDTKIYGSLLAENIVQALSRIVLSQAMIKISERYKVVMSTHDEVVYLARTNDAEEAYNYGLSVLVTPPEWCKGIPLAAEGGYSENYSK